MIVMYFSLKKENTQMAENSRKNEFFERESIAIIAILAAMLLPALQQARDKAKESSCLSNLKQQGMFFFNYSDENQGFLVPGKDTEDETYKGLACKRCPAWFVNVAPYAGGRSTSFCDLATPRPKVFYCPGAKHTLTGSRESSYGYPWKQATEAPWVSSWHRRGKVTRLKRPSQKIWLTESQTAEWFNSSLISNFNSLHAGGKRTMICYQDGRAGGAIKAYVFAKSTTFFGSYFK